MLIDIKHMSFYSRQQFYAFRRKNGYDKIPIIASHMGVTGFAFSRFKDYQTPVMYGDEYIMSVYKEVKGIGKRRKDRTDFNPWSINLYDEEILEIIHSGGLIGISLDQRILGFGKNKEEYFNKDEFEKNTSKTYKKLKKIPVHTADFEEFGASDDLEDARSFEEESNQRGRKRKHLRYLCNNILHIVKIGGEKAWDHICIGSDFDGLINPINNCKSCADFPDLEEDLIEVLQEMAKEDKNTDYFMGNIQRHVRAFMYDNGKRFLNKYFTTKYLTTGVD